MDLIHHLDRCDKFNITNFIVKTIQRTTTKHKRSCGYAPYLLFLINSKIAEDKFLLDCVYVPFRQNLEDNIVTMEINNNPAGATSSEAAQIAHASAAPSPSTHPPVVVPKTQIEQIAYLCQV